MECLYRAPIWLLVFIILLCSIHKSISYNEFLCPTNRGKNLPSLPPAYSTNIRINFETNGYTSELKYAKNEKEHKEFIEFKTQDRRVKYIVRGDENSVLAITYKENEHPTCVVKKLKESEFLQSEDAGPSSIIEKASLALLMPLKFGPAGGYAENGIFLSKWEGCFKDPKVNVSMSFAVEDWRQPYTSSLVKATYPVQVEALIKGATDDDDVSFTALYSNFDPNVPDDTLFQPPEDVYCAGFRTGKSPPAITDYFSYNAEVLIYDSNLDKVPTISNRQVYYDYPDKISRIDILDLLANNASVIDFNAGNQYDINLYTGKCDISPFQSTVNVISSAETKDGNMLKGNDFFGLNDAKLSYNGQFPARGIMADVFTSIKTDPQTKVKSVVTWYFSLGKNPIVEKDVLLRMSVQPLTDLSKKSVVVINFYNYNKEQPHAFVYDLRPCFNDSSSKLFVMTFPIDNLSKESEQLIAKKMHTTLIDVTGVRKQRIFINEVIFSKKYLYIEFDIFEAPEALGKTSNPKEISLDEAIQRLRSAVDNKNFTLIVPGDKQDIFVRPEPGGLNVFSGDRVRKSSVGGYKEASVISLAIGMLFLGLVLGGVALNLIMSKKFGVSLFQKGKYGNTPFSNSN